MKFTKFAAVAAAAALSLATFAVAEGGNEDQLVSQTADAHIVQGLEIDPNDNLNFGKLAIDNDTPTTCFMAPDGTAPTTFAAGLIDVDGQCTGETETYSGTGPDDLNDVISMGKYDVSGEPGYGYTLEIGQPSGTNVDALTILSGLNSMTITLHDGVRPDGVDGNGAGLTWMALGEWDGVLNGSGAQQVWIGGTLNIGDPQASGHYNGSFDLDVAYN